MVAQAILTELRDPRVKDVTVVGVRVSPDMREAKVAVSVMGDDKQKSLSLRGLQNAAGFLQSKIANRIDTRYTPRLQFTIDKGQENALAVGELLAKIRQEKEVPGESTEPESTESGVADPEPSESLDKTEEAGNRIGDPTTRPGDHSPPETGPAT